LDDNCPCNTQYESLCQTQYGAWCQQNSMGACPASCNWDTEWMCWIPAVDANGNEDMMGTPTEQCGSKATGCPCPAQWQSCSDEMGAWCQKTEYGPCPVFCNSTSQACRANVWDTSVDPPQIDWDASYASPETCERMYDDSGAMLPCPCNDLYENQCGDSTTGYFCQDKQWSCPVFCDYTTQVECWEQAYDSSGQPDYNQVTQTCAPIADGCSCNAQYETKCTDSWGTWCQPNAYGSCPVVCDWNTQQSCFTTTYDSAGVADWTTSNESCVALSDPCPCNDQWEFRCEYAGMFYCQEKTWGACPVSCDWDTEQTCWSYPFDSQGLLYTIFVCT
jgi:hypothetical protein